jgi:hypothetical protein
MRFLIIGPRSDFTAGREVTGSRQYFDAGGKVLVAVDPESAADFSFLLGAFEGESLSKDRLHSDYALPPGKTTLQSANYSEHAITAPFRETTRRTQADNFSRGGLF